MKYIKNITKLFILMLVLVNSFAITSLAINEVVNNTSNAENKVLSNNMSNTESEVKQNNKAVTRKSTQPVKSILNVDTSLNNKTFGKNGIHIEGWKLATEANTNIQVFIDNKAIDAKYIKYSYKYDLISIVKGYGTYKENPKPNFDINIPINNISHGSHSIKILLVSQDGKTLQTAQGSIYVDKGIKSILNIDTKLNNAKFNKNGINIEGWKLSTSANTQLNVYIDNSKVDAKYIKYSYKYDLISIVKGYGTYKENPKPNFNINIPVDNISQGNHTIRIELISSDGAVLQKQQNTINVDKSEKSILNIDTNLNNAKFNKNGINIEGWKLSTSANTQLNVYIDNSKIDAKYIKYAYKYDLISIVKGYGTYKENPKPNFNINIPVNNISQGNHTIKIELVATNGTVLQKRQHTINIDKSVKSILNVDTKLNNATFDKNGIHIAGWKLAKEANTKLQVYVDNSKMDDKYIKYSYKYDLISIVKDYGTYKENPTPNFDINIPVDNIANGKHKIKIELVTSDGVVQQRQEYTINIDKSIKAKLNIDTNVSNTTFEKNHIYIEGWKLATEANTKLQIYIDSTKIDDSCIKYSYKYDLISMVKGYGTYKENPKPNFNVDIPTKSFKEGRHTLRIEFTTSDGKVILQKVSYTIYIKNEYKGIDVSENNGSIKWALVKRDNVDFAMIRIGYRGYGQAGKIAADSKGKINIETAKQAGVKVGVYFYTQAINETEAIEEANWVINAIKGYGINYPVAIDFENSGFNGRADNLDRNTRTKIANAFCKTIQSAGYTPMVYTNVNWANNYINMNELTKYDTWIAHWTYSTAKLPSYSKGYTMWQYSNKGVVNGVPGNVDLNIGYKKY